MSWWIRACLCIWPAWLVVSASGQELGLRIAVVGGQPALSWSNQTGRAYRMESAADPEGDWSLRATLTASSPDQAWADETGLAAQVYRVRQLADAHPFNAFQAVLDGVRRNQRITGAVAAVVLPGGDMWIGASGYSHGQVPVRPQTRFEIGSVTKTMVSAMALRMVQEGRLSFDDTIDEWLPELNHPYIAGGITVRMLLSHRSGVYNFGDDIPFRQALFSDWGRYWEPEDVLPFVIAPYFAADQGGVYSNTGYVLAGMILRQASPGGVPTELQRTVFGPAGMHTSFLGVEEGWTGELAHLHLDFNGDGVHEDLDGQPQTAILSSFWTSGAVISTAADVARFGAALFDGTLLDAESLDAMRSFRPVDIGGSIYQYGLGLMRITLDGLDYWCHSGGLFGHYAWFSHCPANGTSVGIVYNYPQTVQTGANFPVDLLRAVAAAVPASSGGGGSPAPSGVDSIVPRPEQMLRLPAAARGFR